jgi:hypothetical protein
MAAKRLYLYVTTLLIASYVYMAWSLYNKDNPYDRTVCVFKNVTGVACPSCGSTRAVMLLAEGNITKAGLTNPLGYLMAFFMVILPFWLLYDVVFKKTTFYNQYRIAEKKLSSKWVIAILMLLVLCNWIWNINKNL